MPKKQKPVAPQTDRPHLLLVEDDVQERASIKEQLELFSFVVEAAEDLKSARKKLKKRYYDGIVLDYRIPPFSRGGDEEAGGVFLRDIRERDAFVPVVVLSAVVKPHQEGALVEDQVTFILHKGSKPEALPEIMERLVRQGEFISSALSEWVQDNPVANRPVLTGPDGKVYSISDVLREIKENTPLGQSLRSTLLKGLLEVYARA